MKRFALPFMALLLAFPGGAQQIVPWNEQFMLQDWYGQRGTSTPRKIDVPDLMGYKTLKCDFHTHTNETDGRISPEMHIIEAWLEGLDAIAITDHQPYRHHKRGYDCNRPYNMALAESRNKGVILIHGLEISSANNDLGHINLLFVNDCNDYDFDFNENFTFEQTHDALVRAKAEGAYIIANHPGWPDEDSELSDWLKAQVDEGLIMGMEVFNAYEFYPRAIDHINKYGLTFIGASDSHDPLHTYYDFDKAHRPLTFVFATGRSQEEIKEALEAHRTIAYANNILAGNREWLLRFLRASLDVELVEDRGYQYRIRIFNNSDIPYILDCGVPSKLMYLPAHRYCDILRSKGDISLIFKVRNMFVSSTENLEVPFSIFTTPKGSIDAPFIDPDKVVAERGSVVVSIDMQDGETWWTTDGSEPSPDNGTLYTGPIKVKESCTVKARNFRDGLSSRSAEYNLLYLKAENVKCKKHGLRYTYYSCPEYGSIKSVEHLKPEYLRESGVASRPAYQPQYKELDWYGYVFEGYLYAPVSGVYRICLDTDDGSRLYLDGKLAIENNYNVGGSVGLGEVYLEKGYHSMKMPYFEGHINEYLYIKWKTPGSDSFVEIPDENFFME